MNTLSPVSSDPVALAVIMSTQVPRAGGRSQAFAQGAKSKGPLTLVLEKPPSPSQMRPEIRSQPQKCVCTLIWI